MSRGHSHCSLIFVQWQWFMLYGRLSRLGYISKTPVKKSTVANPYQRKPVGIGIFVVPKFTSAPPKHANCPWTAGTPIHSKEGREVIDQTPAATEHAPGKATPASKGDERAAQTNGHIIRKKSGKTYNPALLVDPSPPPFTTEEGADLPGHTLTAYDRKPSSVYRYQVHCNDYTGVNSRQCPMADPVALDQQPHAKVLRRAQGQGQSTFRHAPH